MATLERKSNVRALQLAVLAILDKAEHYEWSIQGFGLLRLYIQRLGRLHVWDRALRYPNVSLVHNHSWDLRSTVVCGFLTNRIFDVGPFGEPYHRQRLVTGYQTRMVAPVEDVFLLPLPRQVYGAGDVYAQSAAWVHRTDAEDGTVTVMERHEDEHGEADVYWPRGQEFGTARPRPATPDEVRAATAQALVVLERELADG